MTYPTQGDFFIAGGTLRADASSYIKRPADEELYNHIRTGEFCYVLTPRQMGKSSLMVSTALRLQKDGFAAAKIDLTKIGTTDISRWYLGILTQIEKELKLDTKPGKWWTENEQLSPVQAFVYFLREVLLAKTTKNIVIFIDEIDSTLRYEFRDDFFAGIRSVYNSRAEDPEYNRLTFVLLGVAAPTDLIKDRTRTPFNIGQEISLTNFSREEVSIFEPSLEKTFPGQGAAVLDRIYSWSNGHPYLTQKLCMAVAEQLKMFSDQEIDNFVRQAFLSQEAYRETNLQFVRDMLVKNAQKRQLVSLYARIRRGAKIPEDKKSSLQIPLRLSGLVKSQDGYLVVNNRIYQEAFNLEWIRENTEINWPVIGTVLATIVALFFAGASLYDSIIVPSQIARANDCFNNLGNSPDVRLSCLATMFREDPFLGRGDNDEKARETYFNLTSWEYQRSIFEARFVKDRDLIEVTRGLSHGLANVNQPWANTNTPLLVIMRAALQNIKQTAEVTNLEAELDAWVRARKGLESGGSSATVLADYDQAIGKNNQNPSTLFERGGVRFANGDLAGALQSFDETLAVSKKSAPTKKQQSGTPTPTATLAVVTVPPGPTSTLAVPAGTQAAPTSPPVLGTALPPPPTPVNPSVSIISEFYSHTQRVRAIRDFLDSHAELLIALQSAAANEYTNLRTTPEIASLLTTIRVELTVLASSSTYVQAGERITYTYVINNPGTTSLGPAQFMISDDRFGPRPVNCGPSSTTLAPSQNVTCSTSFTITQADLNVPQIINNVTALIDGSPASRTVSFTIINLSFNPTGPLTQGMTIQHQVVIDEWLQQIARCYGANFEAVRAANPQITDPDSLVAGSSVTVPNIGSTGTISGPPCITLYTVQAGDTWTSIAQQFNADLAELQRVNQVGLAAGIVLRIPLNSSGGVGTPASPTATLPPILPSRITFDPGQTTATRIGVINPNAPIQYVVNAVQGQILAIRLTAAANEVAIGVQGPTGLILKPLDAALTWSTIVSTSGDHLINIASLNINTSNSYVLEVSLTEGTNTALTASPNTKINVVMTDFQFQPDLFTVTAGKEITFDAANNGAVVHNFIIMKLGTTAGALFDKEDAPNVFWELEVPPGATASVTFTAPTQPGEYEVVCGIEGHIAAGMIARLTVVPANNQ